MKMKDRPEVDWFSTGQCDACCAPRLRASAVRSLFENGNVSRCRSHLRVFRVFRGLKSPSISFLVIGGHVWSRLVTFGHLQFVQRGFVSCSNASDSHLCLSVKTKTGKEKVKFRL